MISRQHAFIEKESNQNNKIVWRIKDNSQNGIKVNEKSVSSQLLSNNDKISFTSDLIFIFKENKNWQGELKPASMILTSHVTKSPILIHY